MIIANGAKCYSNFIVIRKDSILNYKYVLSNQAGNRQVRGVWSAPSASLGASACLPTASKMPLHLAAVKVFNHHPWLFLLALTLHLPFLIVGVVPVGSVVCYCVALVQGGSKAAQSVRAAPYLTDIDTELRQTEQWCRRMCEYMHTIHAHNTCTQYMHTIHAHNTCTQYVHTIRQHNTCTDMHIS